MTTFISSEALQNHGGTDKVNVRGDEKKNTITKYS